MEEHKKQYIWLVEQTENQQPGAYLSFICIAPDKQTAQMMLPQPDMVWDEDMFEWCAAPDEALASMVGTAFTGAEPGVLCAELITSE